MFNSKKILLLVSAIVTANVYAEAPAEIDMKDPTAFSKVEMYVSGDSGADVIFKKYHDQYSGYITKINKEMDGFSKDISSNINQEVEKTESYVVEDQAKFDDNCKKELTANEIEQCGALEKSLYTMKDGVASMKNDLKNELAGLENDRLNRLSKAYIGYKNRVGKLAVDVKNNNR